MDVRNVTVPLDGRERSALAKLAERELRDPRDQARLMLRLELEKRGLLAPADGGNQTALAAGVKA